MSSRDKVGLSQQQIRHSQGAMQSRFPSLTDDLHHHTTMQVSKSQKPKLCNWPLCLLSVCLSCSCRPSTPGQIHAMQTTVPQANRASQQAAMSTKCSLTHPLPLLHQEGQESQPSKSPSLSVCLCTPICIRVIPVLPSIIPRCK